MDISLAWLIAGFILIIIELVTGTFYLLVLGIASVIAAAIGYAGGGFTWQAVGATVIAMAGVIWVRRFHRSSQRTPMPALDVGQPTVFDAWVSEGTRHARVKHRDALWDAHVVGDVLGDVGEVLYITAIDGNTLTVSKVRPS